MVCVGRVSTSLVVRTWRLPLVSHTLVSPACRTCYSYLYVALVGFRSNDVDEHLCNQCGWLTGIHHIFGVSCEGCSAWCGDDYFCQRCVHVYQGSVYCFRCSAEDIGGQLHVRCADQSTALIVEAWCFSCDLNDVIAQYGGLFRVHQNLRKRAIPPYPFVMF